MTTSQETISDIAYRSWGAYAHAVESCAEAWVNSAWRYVEWWTPTRDTTMPSAKEIVDDYYRVLWQIWWVIPWEVATSVLATTSKTGWAAQDPVKDTTSKKS